MKKLNWNLNVCICIFFIVFSIVFCIDVAFAQLDGVRGLYTANDPDLAQPLPIYGGLYGSSLYGLSGLGIIGSPYGMSGVGDGQWYGGSGYRYVSRLYGLYGLMGGLPTTSYYPGFVVITQSIMASPGLAPSLSIINPCHNGDDFTTPTSIFIDMMAAPGLANPDM